MLRITPMTLEESPLVLRLEGKLTGDSVEELRHVSEEYLESGREVALDLGSTPFADAKGLQALRDLRNRGVQLRNVSILLDELLSKLTEVV